MFDNGKSVEIVGSESHRLTGHGNVSVRDVVIAVCMFAHARLDRYGRSSERWHVGDAWAQRGDEGRGKLR